jgi:hypothetical protein
LPCLWCSMYPETWGDRDIGPTLAVHLGREGWEVHGVPVEVYNGWLMVWNMNFIFPYIGNNHPNWLSYFSGGLKPPIRWYASQFMPQLWTCAPVASSLCLGDLEIRVFPGLSPSSSLAKAISHSTSRSTCHRLRLVPWKLISLGVWKGFVIGVWTWFTPVYPFSVHCFYLLYLIYLL